MLQGSIADNQLKDIFWLLGTRAFTGTLVVEIAGEKASVGVTDGAVTGLGGWVADSTAAEAIAQLCKLRMGTFVATSKRPRLTKVAPIALDEAMAEADRIRTRDSLRELREMGLPARRFDQAATSEMRLGLLTSLSSICP